MEHGKHSKSDPTDDQDEGCCVFVVCCMTVGLSVCRMSLFEYEVK